MPFQINRTHGLDCFHRILVPSCCCWCCCCFCRSPIFCWSFLFHACPCELRRLWLLSDGMQSNGCLKQSLSSSLARSPYTICSICIDCCSTVQHPSHFILKINAAVLIIVVLTEPKGICYNMLKHIIDIVKFWRLYCHYRWCKECVKMMFILVLWPLNWIYWAYAHWRHIVVVIFLAF